MRLSGCLGKASASASRGFIYSPSLERLVAMLDPLFAGTILFYHCKTCHTKKSQCGQAITSFLGARVIESTACNEAESGNLLHKRNIFLLALNSTGKNAASCLRSSLL